VGGGAVSGEWTGSSQNRHWQRTGHRGGPVDGDAERGERLFEELADVSFWCETCGGCHALAGHQACRQEHVRQILAAHAPQAAS